MKDTITQFYEDNPRMISSPFGGIDGVNRDLLLKVFEALNISLEARHVLDVGCGRGYTKSVVKEAGGDYTGVDLVVSRPGIRMAQADGSRLPFANASFDAVFCIDAFEHFPNPDRAAREFRRVLRPDGFLYLSAPNYSNVAGVVKRVYETLGLYEKNTWAPFGRWQPQELETPVTGKLIKQIFGNAGFKQMNRIGHSDETGLGLFPWIDHPKTPESVQFRLQRLFGMIEEPITRMWPGASLHGFWKIDA